VEAPDLPRGIRNCNPFNIKRDGTQWQGMSALQTDPVFVQFVSPQYGIRAGVKILQDYQKFDHIQTVAEAVTRFAPPSENDTEAYIEAVCGEVCVDPNAVVDFNTLMPGLVKAFTQHENGQQPYSDATINAGIALA